MRNDNIEHFFFNSSYALNLGLPHRKASGALAWDNRTRVEAAVAVISRELSIRQAARRVGCCENSIRNWVKSLNECNPRLNG